MLARQFQNGTSMNSLLAELIWSQSKGVLVRDIWMICKDSKVHS